MKQPKWFSDFTKEASRFTGQPLCFVLAMLLILVWAVTGPVFHFSDTWQLVINTLTNLITFVMVFLIQSTQNRDTEAVQLKLDELIRATQKARNTLLDLEELDEETLDKFRARYESLARKARGKTGGGKGDKEIPES